MYTPVFWVDQDERNLIVRVKAPHAEPSEVDIFFAGKEFLFYCPPYFLRLFLPGEVLECSEECADFNLENSVFTVCAPKRNIGEHFPDLDMLTRLLVPEGSPIVDSCKVKLPGERSATDLSFHVESVEKSPDQLYVQQSLPVDVAEAAPECRYGFANSRDNVFLRFKEETSGHLIDIDDPDSYTIARRRQILREKENDKFSDEAYIADLHNEEVKDLLALQDPWKRRIYEDECFSEGPFSVDEIERLKGLPKKNIILLPGLERSALLSLVDILFGFAYDCRINAGDDCVESGWNIRKLSSTLSGLITWDNIRSPILASVRRSLCYPLIRNFDFAKQVVRDLSEILSAGKVALMKCLLSIHRIFANTGDFVYLFNDLYITDYCVWIQAVREEIIIELGREVAGVDISKEEVDFDLPLLDECSRLALEENKREKEQRLTEGNNKELPELARPVVTPTRCAVHSESDVSPTDSVKNDGRPVVQFLFQESTLKRGSRLVFA